MWENSLYCTRFIWRHEYFTALWHMVWFLEYPVQGQDLDLMIHPDGSLQTQHSLWFYNFRYAFNLYMMKKNSLYQSATSCSPTAIMKGIGQMITKVLQRNEKHFLIYIYRKDIFTASPWTISPTPPHTKKAAFWLFQDK